MSKIARRRNGAWLIYSTLTNGTEFFDWLTPSTDPNQLPVKGDYRVVIDGGAGVAQKRTLVTPLGVATTITQEQMDFLNANADYQRMVKEGWLKPVKAGGWADDPDDVAADMSQRDGSSPIVPNDFVNNGVLQPAVNVGQQGSVPTTKARTRPFIYNPVGVR